MQALRASYAKMDSFLSSQNFFRCKYDSNVYFKYIGDSILIIVLHFDDHLISGSSIEKNSEIKSALNRVVWMTELGLLRQFLGLEIHKSEAGIKFSQPKYASYLLLKFKMAECKATKCPFLYGIKLGEFGQSPLVDSLLYRQLVGIFYILHTLDNIWNTL